jgi:aminoglycoside phosphotransferase (APT) family kinase protein
MAGEQLCSPRHQLQGATMSETMGRLLAAGNVAEVFEWGSRVVKLYRSAARKPTAFREAAIHAAVEAMGLPVPAVWGVQQVGDRWGIVFDRINAQSFAERMRGDLSAVPARVETLARLHARIHAHPARQLGNLKSRLATNIARAELLDESRKQILLNGLAGMPDGDRLCHGDFHPINVLGEISRPVVIDWPDACSGNPGADVCRSYLLLKLRAEAIAEPYLDAYCAVNNMQRASILGWLPYVAAARLSEDVPGDFERLLEIVHS